MSSILQWRQRLLAVRGIFALLIAGGLLLLSARHLITPDASLWALTALLWLPSLWYLPTRHVAARRQRLFLGFELAVDMALFLLLIWNLGGAGNPLTFCLLIPVLIVSLALSVPASGAAVIGATLGYGLLLYWHRIPDTQSGLHALAHDLNLLHGQGMWFVFCVLAVVLSALGQALQHSQRQSERAHAFSLALALQRERMYELAGNLADRAHELNTPLSTLLLILDELEDLEGQARNERLGTLRALAHRIGRVLRPTQGENEAAMAMPLSRLVDEVARRLQLLAPTMTVERQGEDVTVTAIDGWRRILLNLGYNAADAGATRMTVRYRCGERLTVEVQDDGPQHPARQRQGLGIGLALVESTLATLGGEMSIERHPRWTSVLLHCPAPSETV